MLFLLLHLEAKQNEKHSPSWMKNSEPAAELAGEINYLRELFSIAAPASKVSEPLEGTAPQAKTFSKSRSITPKINLDTGVRICMPLSSTIFFGNTEDKLIL